RVGKFNGSAGRYPTIASAVAKAEPGDWILIGPGDYKETGNTVPVGAKGDDRAGAPVLVTKPGVHLRGMNRNTVMLDGTKPGAAQCGGGEAEQDFGPIVEGKTTGRNGLIVFEAARTSVENLTACNFLTGDHGGGDAI